MTRIVPLLGLLTPLGLAAAACADTVQGSGPAQPGAAGMSAAGLPGEVGAGGATAESASGVAAGRDGRADPSSGAAAGASSGHAGRGATDHAAAGAAGGEPLGPAGMGGVSCIESAPPAGFVPRYPVPGAVCVWCADPRGVWAPKFATCLEDGGMEWFSAGEGPCAWYHELACQYDPDTLERSVLPSGPPPWG